MSKICVLIPAYNEASVIKDVIENAQKVFFKSKYDIDIIVVNDGSLDSTANQARSGGATVVDHIINVGAGGATSTALLYARKNKYDLAATMDADGQHSANDVVKGLDLVINSHYDLVIGSRLIDSTGMSKIKVIGNKGLSFITYILFGISATDSQSGLRIYSRKALETLEWKTSGYEFCSEMLWRAKQLNLKISEYPIQAIYTDYSKGKGQNNWNAINIIKSLLRRRLMEMFE